MYTSIVYLVNPRMRSIERMTETKRGGARVGAGRKAEDGASGLVPYTIKLPPALKVWAQSVGMARVRAELERAAVRDAAQDAADPSLKL
jgi:hypothetical protein